MHVYLSRGKITNTDFVNWCNFVGSKKRAFKQKITFLALKNF